jgi:tetratricopeptide (TPR) repeat protein
MLPNCNAPSFFFLRTADFNRPVRDAPKTLQAIAKDVSVVRSCSRASTISSVSSTKMILEATDKMLERYSESDKSSVRYEELPNPEGTTTEAEPQKQGSSRRSPFEKAKQMLKLFGLNPFPWEVDPSTEPQGGTTASIAVEVTPIAADKLWIKDYQTSQAGLFMCKSASPAETPQSHDLRPFVSNAAHSESQVNSSVMVEESVERPPPAMFRQGRLEKPHLPKIDIPLPISQSTIRREPGSASSSRWRLLPEDEWTDLHPSVSAQGLRESYKANITVEQPQGLSDVLDEQLAMLGQPALNLLALISMFNDNSIPEHMLCGGDNVFSATLADSLYHDRSYLDSLATLHNHYLIERDALSSTVSTHILVKSHVLRSLDQHRAQVGFDKAVALLWDALPRFPDPYPSHDTLYRGGYGLLKAHVMALSRVFESRKRLGSSLHISPRFIDILQCFGSHLFDRSNFVDSEFLLRLSWRACKDSPAPYRSHLRRSCLSLCEFYLNTSRVTESSVILREVQGISQRPGKDGEEWEYSLGTLQGRLDLVENDLEIAELTQEGAISRLEQLEASGKGNPVALSKAYTALGETLGYTKQLTKADTFLQKALTSAGACGGQKTAVRASALYALGNVRIAQGNCQEARDLHYRCLNMLESEDRNGFYMAISSHKFGTLKYEDGEFAKAISLLKDAWQIFEKIGADRYTARTAFKLAQIIYEAGDIPFAGSINDAMYFFGKARGLRERITGVRCGPGESFENYDRLVIYSHR